jgi:hypothetical protein
MAQTPHGATAVDALSRSTAALPEAILLGGGPIAVAVARSLARAGATVLALGAPGDPVARSRACAEFTDLGTGEGVQERWLDWLSRRPQTGAVVVPCNDDALELTARHRKALVELGYRPTEADPAVMLDKDRTYALAHRIGVPTPRTVVVRPGDGAELARELQYPCALKPRQSHLFRRHFGLKRKAFQAANAAELSRHLERTRALGLEMIVTEIIPGAEDSFHSFYGYLDERGETLLVLTKRKLRQYPPRFGLATYHMMTWEPEIAALGMRFCKGVGLRRIAVVELKRDPRDGIHICHGAGPPLGCRSGTDRVLPGLGAPRGAGEGVPGRGSDVAPDRGRALGTCCAASRRAHAAPMAQERQPPPALSPVVVARPRAQPSQPVAVAAEGVRLSVGGDPDPAASPPTLS